ncbi:Wadjet anti-phage system protein JetD domain-containing protein [Bradyrhizobium sp. Ce-3]|uniref:Wadjet anti-phage system protein JetD domain-containing protein n=1 Tax=Bradyrhizobium sp. Ce-3 TaxID=2913970 RepID=UPI001FC863B7|nr:Wadjet anti-phage system protein JetD domain-containing protein [Bradyrhizobium sp. Ce-3]
MTEDADANRIRRELQRLAGDRGWVNGSRLVQRLADNLGIAHLEIRHRLFALSQAGVIDNIAPTGDGLGRVTIQQFLPARPMIIPLHEREWRHLLASRTIDPGVEAALREVGPALSGLSRSDMEHLLDGFFRLVADRDTFAGRDPYEISAKYLLGSSKILGKWGKALSAAGLSDASLGSRPRYVLGAGPTRSKFTLLVENPECFERLVGLGIAERITVIATYGYGIAWSGAGTEGRLDRIKIARIAGTPPFTLAEAVAVDTCCFWGDLDLAGLDIFIKLRAVVPHLNLSALYGPMLVAAADPATSHPYCGLVDKTGQIEPLGTDIVISRLADACRLRAVDQEYVADPDLVALADRILEYPRGEAEVAK